MQPSIRPKAWLPTMWVAVALFLAGIAGFAQVFSVLATYDDEGYVMISLQSYLQRQPLYDVTYTQYGPAYYQLQGLLHHVWQLPVTHDVTRLKTVAVWLAASLLCSWIVLEATGNWVYGLIALVAAYCQLDKLCLEPGHPQELCLLATLASIAAGFGLQSHWTHTRYASAIMMGVAIGVAAMTKLNVGILLGLAASCSLVMLLPFGWWQRRLALLSAASAALVPILLCTQSWHSGWSAVFPLMISGCTIGLASWTLRHPQIPRTQWPLILAAAGSAVAVIFGIAAVALWQGTSIAGLEYGLIGQHLGFDKTFFSPVPLMSSLVVVALIPIGLTVSGRMHVEQLGALARGIATWTLILCAVGFVMATFVPLRHGLEPRGLTTALSSLAPLVAWSIVDPRSRQAMGRVHLAWTALLQPLMAYPTAGTQVEIGYLPLLLTVVVLSADKWQRNSLSIPVTSQRRWHLKGGMLAAGLMALLVVRDFHYLHVRNELVPLSVPGAHYLRLPARQARHELALVDYLRSTRCETFLFADHGHNRFYFWTQIPPPTARNATFWPYMLDERAQQDVIDAIASRQKICVVGMPGGAALLPGAPGPLRRYLEQHFQADKQVAGWQIWTRKNGMERADG